MYVKIQKIRNILVYRHSSQFISLVWKVAYLRVPMNKKYSSFNDTQENLKIFFKFCNQ